MKKYLNAFKSTMKDVAIVMFYFLVAVFVYVVPIYFGWENQYLFIVYITAGLIYITNSANGK